jgi:hypothetical protein
MQHRYGCTTYSAAPPSEGDDSTRATSGLSVTLTPPSEGTYTYNAAEKHAGEALQSTDERGKTSMGGFKCEMVVRLVSSCQF